MDFFKSVFADESESESEDEHEIKPDSISANKQPEKDQRDPDPKPASTETTTATSAWGFGGLITTLTTKSESVIETYRRDLQEFGSGLKKEIEEAHGSLGTVSHKFDELSSSVIKGTAQIISHGKDALLAVDDESDGPNNSNDRNAAIGRSSSGLSSKRYSRFEAQLRVIQGDEGTYCEDPEDVDDYRKWKLGFDLSEKIEERERLLDEDGVVAGLCRKVVPGSVDVETFWSRYFYRVWKLEQAEALRVSLVRRAISRDDEELSWDVDDEEDEVGEQVETRNENLGRKGSLSVTADEEKSGVKEIVKGDENEITSDGALQPSARVDEVKGEESEGSEEPKGEQILSGGDNVARENVEVQKTKDEAALRADEKVGSEGKGDNGESSKESEYSVVSSNQSAPEDEDLGWDEIEDLSSIDEKKVSNVPSQNKVDLRKRLSVAEEDEDLSWDIEDDDDDHVKA